MARLLTTGMGDVAYVDEWRLHPAGNLVHTRGAVGGLRMRLIIGRCLAWPAMVLIGLETLGWVKFSTTVETAITAAIWVGVFLLASDIKRSSSRLKLVPRQISWRGEKRTVSVRHQIMVLPLAAPGLLFAGTLIMLASLAMVMLMPAMRVAWWLSRRRFPKQVPGGAEWKGYS